ncbi:MAG: hypothetical protein LPJ98_05255 [Cyclobacteriaceae bacterium]|nr:hypothetical protein [Cyclobacteriaceae bacterium]
MLCGCIPIGSSVNHIPEIIGNTGYILPRRDINLLRKILQPILQQENTIEGAPSPRERIILFYNLENRKNLLFSLLPA